MAKSNSSQHSLLLPERTPTLCIGIDEAGRGCLAGPVVAAAVMLPQNMTQKTSDLAHIPGIEGLNDSKKLTTAARDALLQHIRAQAVAYGIGIVWQKDIDKYNILQATFYAMAKAVKSLVYQYLRKNSNLCASTLYIDGNKTIPTPILTQHWHEQHMGSLPWQRALVGGDALHPSIAAASIIAKTHRDTLLKHLHKRWPQYNFAAHKGYGTKEHIHNIAKYGPCPLHRLTFAKVLPEEERLLLKEKRTQLPPKMPLTSMTEQGSLIKPVRQPQ